MGELMLRIKDRDLVSVTQNQLRVDQSPKPNVDDCSTSMTAFETKIHTNQKIGFQLSFPTLFQIQALVWNNYIQPSKATMLIDLMRLVAKEP